MGCWKGAVFLPAGLILLAGAVYAARETHSFIASSVTAPGIVVAEPFGVHHPEVRFTTREGETTTYLQGGEVTQHVGDRVTVRYSPHNLQGSPSLDTFGALWGTALGLAGLGGVFAVIGGGLLARPTPAPARPDRSARPPTPACRPKRERTVPSQADTAFTALCAPLPAFVRETFLQRATAADPPQSVAEMFTRVEGWLVSTGIAEGRGGYPGGRDRPGWLEYVDEQRRNVAVLRALVDAFGAPSPSTAETLRGYDESFPPSKRLLGDGYEAHVDDVCGRLIYSLPVSSGVFATSFSFPITTADLNVLKGDARRRVILEKVAHTVFSRSLVRGEPEVTDMEINRLTADILHGTPENVSRLITRLTHRYGVDVQAAWKTLE